MREISRSGSIPKSKGCGAALHTLEVGTKKRRLTLESPSETGGDAAVTWTTVATVWAEMLGLGGTELSGIEATVDYRFKIWYRNDINPRWRLGLVGTTRKLQIISAFDPDGRSYELLIVARETV
jgi:SPP1 family predicted phage head-tail adaptor